ncbi:MAG: hypothetical protein IPJ68_03985 [Candidatus Moraniibacteriota bacterium]|nr:MAG: hypothetical protein IPJ68_03985 [Candidatus Moranbacteria bacterium]
MNIEHDWQNFTPDYINLTPNIVRLGEAGAFAQADDLKVKVIDVLNDGRCPKNVNCGNAGWATVLVETEFAGTVEQHEMRIHGGNSGILMPPEAWSNKAGSGNVLEIGPYKMFLAALRPYPSLNEKIAKGDYQGLFLADTLENLDFKKRLVATASEVLKQHLSDSEKYYAVGLTTTGTGTVVAYRVQYIIPYGPADQQAWVEVERTGEELRATKFGR